MQLNVTEVMNQVEMARNSLASARNQLLQAIHVMSGAGQNVTELIRMQERLDEAVALSQTSHDHLAVWHQVDARRRMQQALDSYQGLESDEKAQPEYSRVFDYYTMLDDDIVSLSSSLKDDEDDTTMADDDLPYYGSFTDDDDDDDDDDFYADLRDMYGVASDAPDVPASIILGDERAAVAFDTSDMAWADKPLHEEELRLLFGLRLTPGGDWHYDIFGNWYPGPPKPLTNDNPDYNAPW
ncbi:MAG: hypothetical protein ACK5GU_10980 [Chloroflexota bacterium]